MGEKKKTRPLSFLFFLFPFLLILSLSLSLSLISKKQKCQDSIVDDAEAVRAALVPAAGCCSPQRGRWSVLGQSFGGFVSVTYLCRAPWALTEVLLAGGLPPDAAGWEEEEEEKEAAGEKAEKASASSSSTADRVYDLLFDRVAAQNAKFYRRYPRDAATTTTITLPRPEAFDALAAARAGREVLFTGEMVFPWMFEEVGALRPLARVAERLARKSDWPRLYDLAALRACRVPCAAAVYWEDMYVDFGLSQKTAGRIPTLRQWVTSELMHSGIRDDGARVFEHLMGLVRGSTPLF